jgi:hypothetical protein
MLEYAENKYLVVVGHMLDSRTNVLVLSSLMFLTNAMVAFLNKYYLYAHLFLFLTITSLIVHTFNNIYTNIIDKIAISFVIIYGGFVLFQKMSVKHAFTCFLIILTFLLTIYLYIYGYMNKVYCFSEDSRIANAYHSILHMLSSLGHNLIIIL